MRVTVTRTLITIIAGVTISVAAETLPETKPANTNAAALKSSVENEIPQPTGASILEQIDTNMTSKSSIATTSMTIHGRRSSRTVKSKSWAEGEDNGFTEYLSPARERGTKMLKLGDQLWIYSPDTDRTIRLSGHMLRQSVMGSDLSYEDMMDDPRLSKLYDADIIGTETIDESECWVLSLTAREKDIAYQSRKLWVEKERIVPLREELYAKGGKLLKRISLSDFKQINNRWYPMKMDFKDTLKSGKGTAFSVEEIEFDTPIPSHILTKAALRR